MFQNACMPVVITVVMVEGCMSYLHALLSQRNKASYPLAPGGALLATA